MSIFQNSQQFNSERRIYQDDFKTFSEAKSRLHSLNMGKIIESKSGVDELVIPLENGENDYERFYYESETADGWYFYTIIKYPSFFRLKVYRTHRNKMILASQIGDEQMLIDNFIDTDKMKEFALSEAIIHDNWSIVDYLISHYNINKNPLWFSIRYNKVDILKRLIAKGVKLPEDWLAYCVCNNSYDVTKELLVKQKKHLEYDINELITSWLKRELYKGSETAKLIINILKEEYPSLHY